MYGATFSKTTLLTKKCFDLIKYKKLEFEIECVFTYYYLKC